MTTASGIAASSSSGDGIVQCSEIVGWCKRRRTEGTETRRSLLNLPGGLLNLHHKPLRHCDAHSRDAETVDRRAGSLWSLRSTTSFSESGRQPRRWSRSKPCNGGRQTKLLVRAEAGRVL